VWSFSWSLQRQAIGHVIVGWEVLRDRSSLACVEVLVHLWVGDRYGRRMDLLPGILLVVMALVYLGSEVTLRRSSGGQRGPLNYSTWVIALVPLGIYLIAAVVLSTASWNILNLTSILIVFALPWALGASFRAFTSPEPRLGPAALAGGLSLVGLFTVALGYQT